MAKYCRNCGNEIKDNYYVCPKCGARTDSKEYTNVSNANSPNTNNGNVGVKSKLAAGLLGIFLGGLGIHNFYLGYNNKGLTQLLIGIIGSFCCGLGILVSSVWGIIDAIMIFTGSINQDADGNPLGE